MGTTTMGLSWTTRRVSVLSLPRHVLIARHTG